MIKKVREKQQREILKIFWYPLKFLSFSIYFSKFHFTVGMQTTLDSCGSILLGALFLIHHLLTLH